MFNTDPERTIEEILADIQRGAISAASSGKINLVRHVLAPAALLVKLSRDSADAMARVVSRGNSAAGVGKILHPSPCSTAGLQRTSESGVGRERRRRLSGIDCI